MPVTFFVKVGFERSLTPDLDTRLTIAWLAVSTEGPRPAAK
ncbi:MAG TPA: hypothetical protein VMM15_22320 [Bradyrhizobium sp.]|nr:hypothetical protein [Bradyrhizobium sp.]